MSKTFPPATAETFETINQWQRETFPGATADGNEAHLREEWEEFNTASTLNEKIVEAVDMIILLIAWIDSVSSLDPQVHIDAKMQINRARSWRYLPDGTGRHV